MIAALLLAHLLTSSQQDGVLWKKVTLQMPPKSTTILMYQGPVEPLDPPKESPKKFGVDKTPWQFPWMTDGFAQTSRLRLQKYFRVFAQEQKGDRIGQVTQMLLRLWNLNYDRLGLTHSPQFDGGLVEVYLCFGGRPGGEQLFDVDKGIDLRTHKPVDVPVNTIYIYDMASFTDPVEMAREVAHEYGHATLPPIGGYTSPEYWADGYLGEKLMLRWIRDDMAAGRLGPLDAMGVTKEQLDKWLEANVDPLVQKAAVTFPSPSLLGKKDDSGMNAFIGESLYVDTILGDAVYARSLKMGVTDVRDYPANAVLAAEEPIEAPLTIPPFLYGKSIWIPLGTGKLKGAVWTKRDPTGWVQIAAKPGPISILNPQ